MSQRAEARVAEFSRLARERGLRLTHQRLEVFAEIARREDHPTAEAVYRAMRERVPTVSLDTVYRTLRLLHDWGLLDILGARAEGVRFDPQVEPHHHFVCTRCGHIYDFTSAELDALAIPAAARELGEVSAQRVEVRGICRACEQRGETAGEG